MHLTAYRADAFPFTEEHLKQLEEKLEEQAKGWPEKVKHELHPEHELIRSKRSTCICDACRDMGSGWSFCCRRCEFDLHPKCALKEDENTGTQKGKEGWILSRPESRIHDRHIGKVPLQGSKPMRTQTYIQSFKQLNQSSTQH